jgi:signal transduction histidine kinase
MNPYWTLERMTTEAANAAAANTLEDEPGRLDDRRELEVVRGRLRREAQRVSGGARQRSAEIAAVLGPIQEAFFMVSPEGRATIANHSAQAMLSGGDRLSDVLANFSDDRDGSPSVTNILDRGTVELSHRITGRAFEARAYPAEAFDTIGHDSVSSSTILILRDVTDERRSRAIQDALVGMLSHELRTPVSSIYTASVLLTKNQRIRTDVQRQELISDVAIEADRLRRLIEDLFVLTKTEGGELHVEAEPIHLPHLLEALVREERTRWPDHRIELTVDPHLPAINGEATYVQQIIENLVSNAVKYSERGSMISIDVTQVETAVDIHIQDDGPGVSPGDRDHLFELLFRSQATAGNVQGAGIGLFVSRTLARAMGGDIRIDDRPGRGSDFVVRIPMYQDD